MAQKKLKTISEGSVKRVVKLIPDPNFVLSYPRFYSNVVSIQSTPFDFTLRFCEALPIYKSTKEGQEIESKMPIKAEVVIPREVFPLLIEAMKDHYDKHIKAHGKENHDEKKK
jgi:hypothetical protein